MFLLLSNVEPIQVLSPDGDADSDGLANLAEATAGSDPFAADTDGGGEGDGDEIARGADPLDPTDDACVVTVWYGDVYATTDADLAPLRCIEEITGALTISGDVTTLTGLSALTHIGDSLDIIGATTLTSLAGLDHLMDVGYQVNIRHNPGLTTLTGLGALATIADDMHIVGNDGLITLSGLDALTIARAIDLWDNAGLTSLEGLGALTSVSVFFIVSDNPSLTSLHGADALTAVGENLIVYNNDMLVSLAGLDAVAWVGRDVEVAENEALNSLAALEALQSVSGDLRLYNNPSLCPFEVTALDARLAADCVECDGNQASTTFVGDFTAANDADVESLYCVGSVTGSLTIRGTATSLAPLGALTAVGGRLFIRENTALYSLAGLEAVTTIGTTLDISENPRLTDLIGLDGLTTVGSDATIHGNLRLTSLGLQQRDPHHPLRLRPADHRGFDAPGPRQRHPLPVRGRRPRRQALRLVHRVRQQPDLPIAKAGSPGWARRKRR